jgi:hypothetical protein
MFQGKKCCYAAMSVGGGDGWDKPGHDKTPIMAIGHPAACLSGSVEQ